MLTPTELRDLRVLLISNSEDRVNEVRRNLFHTLGLGCHIWHCPDLAVSFGVLHDATPAIDVVLVDADLVNTSDAPSVFLKMRATLSEVPVIVFNGEIDRAGALHALENGADDSISCAQSDADPLRLRTAIEKAMIRARFSQQRQRQHTAQMIRARRHHAAEITKANRSSAAFLESAKLTNEHLRNASSISDAAHLAATSASHDVLREKDQIILWLTGGYSVESTQS